MADHGNHDWIEGAVKHPGALTEKAKRAGESLSKFKGQHHDNPTTQRQVALAKTLGKMHHGS